MRINKTKMTFAEFVARCETCDFKPEDHWISHWRMRIKDYANILRDGLHMGDCTNNSNTCDLCELERLLKEYKEYSFNPEKWIIENYPDC